MMTTTSTVSAPPAGRMLGRSGWAVLDQAAFSAANWLIHVLLVRWLPENAEHRYGAFVVAFTWFQMVGTIHTALLVEPMLVFALKRHGRRLNRYYGILSAGTMIFGILSTVLLGLIALAYLIFGEPAEDRRLLAVSMLSLALASPGVWMLWLARRVCYVHLRPQRAAIGGVLYAGLIIAGMYCLRELNLFRIPTAMAVFGVSSAIIALLLLLWEKVKWPRIRDWPMAVSAWRDHLKFGRWSVGSGLVAFIPNQLHYFLLPIFVGLAAGGSMRAVGNLFQPFIQANAAVCVLLIPMLARARGTPSYGKILFYTLAVVAGGPAIWWLICGTFNEFFLQLTYGNRYSEAASLVWVLGLVPIIIGAGDVANASLKASDKPQNVFWAAMAAAIFSITVGVFLTWRFGLIGAAMAIVLALVIQTVLSWRYVFAGFQRPAISADLNDVGNNNLNWEQEATPGTVLINAFACEPGRGSEPGIGWNLVRAAAAHRPVVAVVHPLHAAALDLAVSTTPTNFPIQIEYVGMSAMLDRLWATHWTLNFYYYLWQFKAARKMRELVRTHNIVSVQHATYGRYWMPSAAGMLGRPFTWGPVGGGETMPTAFLRDLPITCRVTESLRELMRWVFERDPMLRRVVNNASLGLATSEESAQRMRRIGVQNVRVLPGAWLSDDELAEIATHAQPEESEHNLRLITIGRQLCWKGTHLAIRALAQARQREIELWVVGDGPALKSLKRLAKKLGVAEQVSFFGWQTRQSTLDLLGRADAMIFPSLHDSGGMAVLEALAAGKPVACLNLGGPGLMVNDECGVLIEPTTPQEAVQQLSRTLQDWTNDPQRLPAMSRAARLRARTLSNERRQAWSRIVRGGARSMPQRSQQATTTATV